MVKLLAVGGKYHELDLNRVTRFGFEKARDTSFLVSTCLHGILVGWISDRIGAASLPTAVIRQDLGHKLQVIIRIC